MDSINTTKQCQTYPFFKGALTLRVGLALANLVFTVSTVSKASKALPDKMCNAGPLLIGIASLKTKPQEKIGAARFRFCFLFFLNVFCPCVLRLFFFGL